jgi:sn-glycerol 3-phosphate transport system permease protein
VNPSTPILVLLLSALAGAALVGVRQRGTPRRAAISAGVGALAGAAGAAVFMVPLNFCTFEAERDPIDFWFGIGLTVIGVLLVTGLASWVLGAVLQKRSLFEVQASPGAFRGSGLAFLFLAPTLIILILFLYYPFIDTFRLATLLARLGIPRTAFVCVDNFTRLVGNADYMQVLGNTIWQSIAIVVFSIVIALLIALAAYQPVRGARIYRALLIWPYAISPVVAGIIFLILFNPTGGIINYALQNVFNFSIPWLNNPAAAPWAVIIVSVWKSLGFNILFYIAGLQNVPKDLLEAASIDGANIVQRFLRITVPMLSPITFFLIITNTTYAFFDTFGTIDTLTGGGPLRSTASMMYSVYEMGIQNNDLGKAAAQSIVLFIFVIGLTVLQFRTAGQRVSYGA